MGRKRGYKLSDEGKKSYDRKWKMGVGEQSEQGVAPSSNNLCVMPTAYDNIIRIEFCKLHDEKNLNGTLSGVVQNSYKLRKCFHS